MADADTSLIRIAQTSDADSVWVLLDSCRSALREQDIAQWDAVYPTADTVRADIAAARLFVFTAADRCVGAITLDANPDAAYASVPWNFADPALIVHRLCIAPGMQGKGLGHRLMEFAEQHAASEGYRSIRLDAYSANPSAVALYRRREYRQVAELFFPRRTLPFYLFEWAVPYEPG
jgi:ribosomal protein S18 acetylase RimI-like enzyme